MSFNNVFKDYFRTNWSLVDFLQTMGVTSALALGGSILSRNLEGPTTPPELLLRFPHLQYDTEILHGLGELWTFAEFDQIERQPLVNACVYINAILAISREVRAQQDVHALDFRLPQLALELLQPARAYITELMSVSVRPSVQKEVMDITQNIYDGVGAVCDSIRIIQANILYGIRDSGF